MVYLFQNTIVFHHGLPVSKQHGIPWYIIPWYIIHKEGSRSLRYQNLLTYPLAGCVLCCNLLTGADPGFRKWGSKVMGELWEGGHP